MIHPTPILRAALVLAAMTPATQNNAFAQSTDLDGRWTAAVEFGELPLNGSRKVGLSLGYHLNEHVWVGIAYQIPDAIQRGETSFNANSLGLQGLTSSREAVGQRAYLQGRLRPHRHAPYISVGAVFNDRDTETMAFDDRGRDAGGHGAMGEIHLQVSRPPALRPAVGLGYGWTSASGVTAFVEWSGWWLRAAPDPDVTIHCEGATDGFAREVERRLRSHFTSSLFNTYHIFQMGVGVTP
jgi:hypothetical protein